MIRSICLLVLRVVLVVSVYGNDLNRLDVAIKQGYLRGKLWKTRNGRQISAFMGIPFAEPPIGALRFQPPVPKKPWKGVIDATEVHTVCPQRNIYTRSQNIEGEEDCLYLNVYTPQVPETPSKLYPVLVFLHGGGWVCGGGNSMWYAPDIMLDKDVVLVVPNYRLGPLGLFSTGDDVVPGNNALKDQVLALKWIKENIEHFGGNSDQVMLFGESAGGVSTHLHLLSPLSQGLIHAAISQSGTALAPWGVATTKENAKTSRKLGELLKCPTSSSQKMLECLRKIPAYDIIAQDTAFMEWDTDPMIPFRPVIEPNIEGAFLTEHPVDIIKSGKSGTIPWMTGVNSEDGALRAAAIFGNGSLMSELDLQFDRIAPISLFYNYDGVDKAFISKQIRRFYFQDKKIDDFTRANAINMYTGGWFLANAHEAVTLHKKYSKNPVYYYLFSHYGIGSITVQFGDDKQRYGVCHADELQYLFPIGDTIFPDKKPDALDKRVSEITTTLWTNFAQLGDPTPETNELIHTKWKPVENEKDLDYFIIGGGVHRANGLYEERVKFWSSLPIHTKAVYKDEL